MLGKLTSIGSGIKAFVSYFGVMLTVLEAVQDLVKTFEEEDVEDGKENGDKKKQAVLDTIEVLYEEGQEFVGVDIGTDRVLTVAEKLIDIVVNFYNVVGIFRQ